MKKDPIVAINPAFKGAFTMQDLLSSEYSLYLKIGNTSTLDDGIIFNIIDNDFILCLRIKNNRIELQRNDAICAIPLGVILGKKEDIVLSIIWSHRKLILGYTVGDATDEKETSTTSTAPPAKLIKWVRKHNLLPTETYKTEEEFREKIHACLITINQKIKETDAFKSFWDITYDANKITDRKPKKEVDIQPLIHAFLSDQMLVNNIELIPEYKTGEGNLDFLFIGNVDNLGMCKFCAEFKLAHSSDLDNGLWHQLPRYMDVSNATYGAYCVLNFKGDWFDLPVFSEEETLDIHLTLIPIKERKPVHRNIRNFIFNLGKPATASKKSR